MKTPESSARSIIPEEKPKKPPLVGKKMKRPLLAGAIIAGALGFGAVPERLPAQEPPKQEAEEAEEAEKKYLEELFLSIDTHLQALHKILTQKPATVDPIPPEQDNRDLPVSEKDLLQRLLYSLLDGMGGNPPSNKAIEKLLQSIEFLLKIERDALGENGYSTRNYTKQTLLRFNLAIREDKNTELLMAQEYYPRLTQLLQVMREQIKTYPKDQNLKTSLDILEEMMGAIHPYIQELQKENFHNKMMQVLQKNKHLPFLRFLLEESSDPRLFSMKEYTLEQSHASPASSPNPMEMAFRLENRLSATDTDGKNKKVTIYPRPLGKRIVKEGVGDPEILLCEVLGKEGIHLLSELKFQKFQGNLEAEYDKLQANPAYELPGEKNLYALLEEGVLSEIMGAICRKQYNDSSLRFTDGDILDPEKNNLFNQVFSRADIHNGQIEEAIYKIYGWWGGRMTETIGKVLKTLIERCQKYLHDNGDKVRARFLNNFRLFGLMREK